jgi:hypothetical protein
MAPSIIIFSTIKLVSPVIAPKVAEITVVPLISPPVTAPNESIVAYNEFDDSHVTKFVKSAVEPSP